MSTTDRKIDAIALILLSPDESTREQAREELARLMEEPPHKEPTDPTIMIHEILAEVGVPAGFAGHTYLVDAINAVVQNPLLLEGVTRKDGLYAIVAKKHGKDWGAIERGVRHCIEGAWQSGNYHEAQQKYCFPVSQVTFIPTPLNFIARVANIVRFRTKQQ